MPTILHEKNYIKKQKITNLVLIIIALLIMISFYITYKVYKNSTLTIYLVLAALCAIPVALFATRYMLFFPYKDCDNKIVDELYKLPSHCYIINSALFTAGKENGFIENIIISANNVICIIDELKKDSDNSIHILKCILDSKKIDCNIITIKSYSKDKLDKYIFEGIKEDTENLFKTIKTHLI